jgi:hypothetical protein
MLYIGAMHEKTDVQTHINSMSYIAFTAHPRHTLLPAIYRRLHDAYCQRARILLTTTKYSPDMVIELDRNVYIAFGDRVGMIDIHPSSLTTPLIVKMPLVVDCDVAIAAIQRALDTDSPAAYPTRILTIEPPSYMP